MSNNGIRKIVISGAARTPIGNKCGALSGFSAEDLAVLSADEAIRRSGIKAEEIDAAVGANVYQFTAPGGQDIYFPRNVALRSGLRTEAHALMVQRICGSGFQTIICAMQQIMMPDDLDDTSVVLCFGSETMSRATRIDRAPRHSAANFWEFKPNGKTEDTILAGLDHTLANTTMMKTADEYGHQMGVTRHECDVLADRSHERARNAEKESHFNGGDKLKGMFAVEAVDLNGKPVHLAHDECVRDTSLEELERLPGFTLHGLVSAGNASEICDGAAAAIVADRSIAEKHGLPVDVEVVSYGIAGVEPRIMGQGPVPSIRQAVARAGLKLDDVDLFEINEAFAAQYLGVEKELNLNREKVNVNGGAVAVGHPLAATGTRLVVDLIYELKRRGLKYGCASACIGGGQGAAILIRNTAVD